MSRTTHLETQHDGATLTTRVSQVDIRSGERRDTAITTARYRPMKLRTEDFGREIVLAERTRSNHR